MKNCKTITPSESAKLELVNVNSKILTSFANAKYKEESQIQIAIRKKGESFEVQKAVRFTSLRAPVFRAKHVNKSFEYTSFSGIDYISWLPLKIISLHFGVFGRCLTIGTLIIWENASVFMVILDTGMAVAHPFCNHWLPPCFILGLFPHTTLTC